MSALWRSSKGPAGGVIYSETSEMMSISSSSVVFEQKIVNLHDEIICAVVKMLGYTDCLLR